MRIFRIVTKRCKAGADSPLAGLPATFANTPGCDDCLGLTLTLRAGRRLPRARAPGAAPSSTTSAAGARRPTACCSRAGATRRGATRCSRPTCSIRCRARRAATSRARRRSRRCAGRSASSALYDGARVPRVPHRARLAARRFAPGRAPAARSSPRSELAASLVAIDGRFEAQGGREVLRGAAACRACSPASAVPVKLVVPMENKRVLLASRPSGWVSEDNFRIDDRAGAAAARRRGAGEERSGSRSTRTCAAA